jgi:hypothetical protein
MVSSNKEIIICIIIGIIIIFLFYNRSENFTTPFSTTPLSATEACQNVASMYNQNNITATNITATGNLGAGTISATNITATNNLTTNSLTATGRITATGGVLSNDFLSGVMPIIGTPPGNLQALLKYIASVAYFTKAMPVGQFQTFLILGTNETYFVWKNSQTTITGIKNPAGSGPGETLAW